jgi:predicted Rossmann fold nucleotide-binding protein DprA/Smf involved in DNA uptake
MGWHSVEELADAITGDKRIERHCAAECDVPAVFHPTWRHLMETRGAQLDALVLRTGMDGAEMRRQLHAMEMGGWVRRMPGGWFVPLKI